MTSREVTLAGWAAIAAAVLVAELVGLRSPRFPTMGDVLEFLMRSPAGRWTVLLGWVWLGWHLFVR
jgi:Family of unknown function (DUF6186)